MTTAQILELESKKADCDVLLFEEGVFFKAYERSAWLFYHCVKPYLLKKRFVKAVGQEIVYLGFPISASEDLPQYNGLDKVRILNVEQMCDMPDYVVWKDSVPLENTESPKIKGEGNALSDLSKKILNFPIESKTPVECMVFLAEIKKELQAYGDVL